ncbi:MAG: hypothetical protein Hens3KO_01270 [Henriciella sp.]
MSPDEINNWIALVALAFSAVALAISIYNALINRPRLRIDARSDIVVITGPAHREGPFVEIVVTNVGTQPTTVTGISIGGYEHAWTPRFGSSGNKAVLMGGGHSTPLPKSLGPGEYLNFFANEDNEIYEKLLNKPACYIYVNHSWGRNPKAKRIQLVKEET